MSQTIYTKLNDPAVATLIGKTFGRLNLKQAAVVVHDAPGMSLTSYWSGGRKQDHMIVRLADMEVVRVPENGSGFSAADHAFGPAGFPVELPAPGYAVVSHTTGNYCAIAVHIHADNAVKMLPKPIDLTWAEQVVLTATRSLKSSYAGIKEYRFHEAKQQTGITRAEWDVAKANLTTKGMLNGQGAITLDGKNAPAFRDLYCAKNRPQE